MWQEKHTAEHLASLPDAGGHVRGRWHEKEAMHVASRDLGRLGAGRHDVVQQVWYPSGWVNAQLTGCALEQGLGPRSHSNKSASPTSSDTFSSLAPKPPKGQAVPKVVAGHGAVLSVLNLLPHNVHCKTCVLTGHSNTSKTCPVLF